MNDYLQRLASAFKTDPSTYNFVEHFVEEEGCGACACGHPIKDVFIVENDQGHSLPLGCVCITRYDKLDHIHAQVKEYQSRKKVEARQEEIKKLWSELSGHCAAIQEAIELKIFVDRGLFLNRFLPNPDNYTTDHGFIRRLKKELEYTRPRIQELLDAIQEKKARREKWQKARAQENAKSNWIGDLGERVTLSGEVLFQKAGDKMDGDYWMITKIKVGSDLVTTWSKSEGLGGMNRGDRIDFRGTVKAHETDSYSDGAKVTLLNRVKVLEHTPA